MSSGRIETLPAGAALTSWLRAGGRPERAGRSQLLLYRWRSWWFEQNLKIQRQTHPSGGRLNDDELLFVMGMWRSGTTYMHELLIGIPGIGGPQTWQCMNPSAFLLQKPPQRGQAQRRPMDAVMVDMHSPQEDEFFLLAVGAPSVYRQFLDPRRWRETLDALRQKTWLAADMGATIDAWTLFLRWCRSADNQRLAVKSPNHVFRKDLIAALWPNAPQVWVLRDPEAVWHSNRKMWKAMFERYALWNWRSSEIDDFLAVAFEAYAESLETLLSSPPAHAVAIDFNDFSRSPATFASSLARWLGLTADVPPGSIPPSRQPESYAEDPELLACHGALIQRTRILQAQLLQKIGLSEQG